MKLLLKLIFLLFVLSKIFNQGFNQWLGPWCGSNYFKKNTTMPDFFLNIVTFHVKEFLILEFSTSVH